MGQEDHLKKWKFSALAVTASLTTVKCMITVSAPDYHDVGSRWFVPGPAVHLT